MRYKDGGGVPVPASSSPRKLHPSHPAPAGLGVQHRQRVQGHGVLLAEPKLKGVHEEQGVEGEEQGGGLGGQQSWDCQEEVWEGGEEGYEGGWAEGEAEGGDYLEGNEEVGWQQTNPPITRSFVPSVNPLSLPPDCPRLRVVSYNVLGAHQALSPIHNYCPMEYRLWDGEGGRCENVIAELDGYEADVMCLQEVGDQTCTLCSSFRPPLSLAHAHETFPIASDRMIDPFGEPRFD